MSKIETLNIYSGSNQESYDLRDFRIPRGVSTSGTRTPYYLPYVSNVGADDYETALELAPSGLHIDRYDWNGGVSRLHILYSEPPSASDTDTHFRVGLNNYGTSNHQNWIDLRYNESEGYEGLYASYTNSTTASGHWLIYHNGTVTTIPNSPWFSDGHVTTQANTDSSTKIASARFAKTSLDRRINNNAIITATGSTTVANNTDTQLLLYTFPRTGIALCSVKIAFATSATGYRTGIVQARGNSSASWSGTTGYEQIAGVSGAQVNMLFPIFLNVTSTYQMRVLAHHTIGSSVTVTATMRGYLIAT